MSVDVVGEGATPGGDVAGGAVGRGERASVLIAAAVCAAVALVVRLAVVGWAASRIPPVADGVYYDALARRLAAGEGYTWLWPDGAVTHAAHYPVGYPALSAVAYALWGPHPSAAMVVNALLGSAAAAATAALVGRFAGTARALVAGLLVALHPALVPYTAALMTEGVTSSLVALALLLTAAARDARGRRGVLLLGALGAALGVATLIRPQSLLFAPALGALAVPGDAPPRRRAAAALAAALVALAVCAPWTARNCARMGRCALVSVNGGWNLLLGTEGATWTPLVPPPVCREVWDEAEKDACFGRAARARIARDPQAWLALAPGKLAATFDYSGAAGYYLHEANPEAFPRSAKVLLGAAETAWVRLTLLAALAAAALAGGPRRPARIALALAGALFAVGEHAWPAYLALAAALSARGRSLFNAPVVASGAVVVLLATIAAHAAFFGAGRYALVVFPVLSALAACAGSSRL